MQVTAGTFGQNISLNLKQSSLKNVLKEIKSQSGYSFFYYSDAVANSQISELRLQNATLNEALTSVCSGLGLGFEINGKIVTIKKKEPSIVGKLIARFQEIDVRGKVIDENGQPLPGATIKIKGSNKSTKTNAQGEFLLQGVSENAVLEISFIGYVTQEIKTISNMDTIKMIMDNSKLEEVMINAGYYTVKDRERTGSISRITAKEIETQPVSNPIQALYGKVPGLVIKQGSGIQGSGFDVEIRGQNSLRKTLTDNGNVPLYIIDGIPFSSTSLMTSAALNLYAGQQAPGASPFNSLNPADIESIEILKDADATAIYGSRGANGVVLITTKKGKEGVMKIDFNGYIGAGKVTRKIDLLNTAQYVEMRNEAFKNSGTKAGTSDYDMNGTWSQTDYTDWQEELIGGTSNITDAQLGLSGGSALSQYRFSGGIHRETAVFPGDFSDWRASGSLNLSNTSPNKKFKSQVNMNYSLGQTDLLQNDLTLYALELLPNHPALTDGNGNLVWSVDRLNPLGYTKQPYDAKSKNLLANLVLEYEILTGLSIKSNFSYTTTTRKEFSKSPLSSTYNPTSQFFDQNVSRFGNSSNDSWMIEPQINWQKTFGQHQLSFLAGSTFQSQQTESLFQSAAGFTNEEQMNNISAAANVYNTYTASKYRYNALFSRINYNYKSTYILNITGRRDGSSRFGPGKQFANFAAIGAAWIFSNIDFVKDNLSILSLGKLRASYGTTGSDQTSNYGYLDLFKNTNTYQGVRGVEPKQLFNPDYAWEMNKKFEVALELGMLKDRILLTTAFYRNRSSNQLVGYPLPPTTGFLSVQKNLDATVQNTGLELELNTQNISSGTLRWNTSFNLTFPKNKLLSYPNLAGSSFANTFVVGQPLSIRKTFKSLGVNPETGLNEVLDTDGNGVFNTADRTQIMFIGQRYFGGLSNSLQWKGLELDILFQFVKQQGLSYFGNFGNVPGMGFGNLPAEVMNRWQKPGDITPHQKFQTTNSSAFSNFKNSDAAISDASFIRLKNVSVSYQLPLTLVNQAKIKSVRVYIQGQNLITLTNYGGLDPETQSTTLPPLRFLTAGLQLSL